MPSGRHEKFADHSPIRDPSFAFPLVDRCRSRAHGRNLSPGARGRTDGSDGWPVVEQGRTTGGPASPFPSHPRRRLRCDATVGGPEASHVVCRWSGCRDLNPGPLDPQSSALTKLRHSPLCEKPSLTWDYPFRWRACTTPGGTRRGPRKHPDPERFSERIPRTSEEPFRRIVHGRQHLPGGAARTVHGLRTADGRHPARAAGRTRVAPGGAGSCPPVSAGVTFDSGGNPRIGLYWDQRDSVGWWRCRYWLPTARSGEGRPVSPG